MATEENNIYNEPINNEQKEEELKKALEKKIKLQKELEEKRMEEIKRRPKLAGPPRLKKNYGCEQKFIINFEIEKLKHRISLEFRTDEKISDIMAKLIQIYKINSRIILIFENKKLNPDSLISETELYPYCTLKVIF